MKKIIATILFLLSIPLFTNASIFDYFKSGPVLGDGNIGTLDKWVGTSTPVDSITQRTYGKPVNISGLLDGCLYLSSSLLTSTGSACGSGGGSGSAYPFSLLSNYAVTNQATTGIVWFQNGYNASSTSRIGSTTFDISGSVGIGTTTPGSLLSIAGVANFASTGSTLYSNLFAPYYTATSTTNASTFPYASTTALTVGTFLNFLGYSSSAQLYAGDPQTGLHFDGPGIISFHNSNVQTLLLSSINNVGIASSSPGQKLSVGGDIIGHNIIGSRFNATSSIASVFPYASTTAFTTTNAFITKISNLTSNGLIKTAGSDGTISTATNGTDYTLISATSCSAGQHVSVISASGAVTCSSDTGGSGGAYPFTPATNYNVNNQATTGIAWFQNGFNASSTSRVGSTTFDINGNVGIGTTTPAAKLHVLGANYSSAIIDAPSYSTLDFRASGTNYGYVGAGQIAGGGTSDLGIKSSGLLQFASGNTTSQLTINGSTITTPAQWNYTGNGTTNVYDSSGGSGFGFKISGTQFATVGSSANSLSGGATTDLAFQSNNNIVFATGGTALSNIRMFINSLGNVGIGTTSPYRSLSVADGAVFGSDVRSSYYTATSSTASRFPFASTTAISNINGEVLSIPATFIVSTSTNTGNYTDIQTAINNLPSNGGKIFVRAGTYTITSPILYKTRGIIIEGEGDATQINFNGGTLANAVMWNATGLQDTALVNVYINNTSGSYQGIGINASNTPKAFISGVRITGTATSTSLKDTQNQTFYNIFNNMNLIDNKTCIDMGGTNPVNNNVFKDIRCGATAGQNGFGLYSSTGGNGSMNNSFYHFDSEPNGSGVGITALYLNNAINTNLENFYAEGNGIGYNLTATTQRTNFVGGTFKTNTTYTQSSSAVNFQNTSIESVTVNQLAASTSIQDTTGNDATTNSLSLRYNTNFAKTGNGIDINFLNSTDTGSPIHIVNPGTGSSIKIDSGKFSMASATPLGYFSINPTASEIGTKPIIAIGSSTNTVFTIDNGGRVGIGTTTPWGKLSVNPNALGSGVPEFVVGSSTATHFVVDGGGNVGIGKTTPSVTLDVTGRAAISTSLALAGATIGTNALSIVGNTLITNGNLTTNSGSGAYIYMAAPATSGGGYYLNGSANYGTITTNTTISGVSRWMLGYSSSLTSTSPTSVITWTDAGKAGVSTTTPWRTFSVTGTVGFDGLGATGASESALCLNANKEVTFNTGVTTCLVSSARFKHDINDGNVGLDLVRKLRPVSFVYNGQTDEHLGFIAEEVFALEPRLASIGSDGLPRSVRYEELTSVLAKSIQELNKKVDSITINTKKSVEDNWQWAIIGLLVIWNIGLTIKNKK